MQRHAEDRRDEASSDVHFAFVTPAYSAGVGLYRLLKEQCRILCSDFKLF